VCSQKWLQKNADAEEMKYIEVSRGEDENTRKEIITM
jgi:hypothetical protein